MITRDELYSREAAELLRVVSGYRTLYIEQVVRLFPGKEDSVRNLIYILSKQKRLFISEDGRMVSSNEKLETDAGTIKAFYLLLEYIDKVDFHMVGDFPVVLTFFLDEELYEVIYIPSGQEAMICHALGSKEMDGKRIIIVDDAAQTVSIDIPGISGFCTVSSGNIRYFKHK